tara:strand:- start:3166 stop:4074 length:909 start_codon:yes stop_codon:yes gene_type:complete
MSLLGDSLQQIVNTPELRKDFQNSVDSLIQDMGDGVGINFTPTFITSINNGVSTSNAGSGINNNNIQTHISNIYNDYYNFNENFVLYNQEINNIFDYIVDDYNTTDYLKNKINTQNKYDIIIENAYQMYYNNIKKLKLLKGDISFNINSANIFLEKLQNYTNTNPNLHLLSKTKDKLQNKIDSYEKHMNIDSKLNKELERNIENNKNYNYYLLIIYYVILILFFIFSNFMKNKYYKNPVATIMIILYIIAPFIIKYILLYMYKFYLYIMKKFNLLNTGLTYEDIVKYDSYNYENNQENISYI